MTRLQKAGVVLNVRMKLTLLEEAEKQSHRTLVMELQRNPLPKLLGDNLDVFVKGCRGNKDLHLFTSIMVFPRKPYMDVSTLQRNVQPEELEPGAFLLNNEQRLQLMGTGAVIVGRIVADSLPFFGWAKDLLPKHIPHPDSHYMAVKSAVHPLPMIDKNEAKYEDCFDIMDDYERQMVALYREAFGKL